MIRCGTALVKTLEALGTETAFVYNGHGNWALLDAIKHESGIRGIACRGEGLAVHMADGYYRSNGKGRPALVTASVGPGNMNIMSALANAFFESSAMVVLAGAGAFGELAILLEEFGLPLCTTTMGKGAYPENKPLCLGAIGRSGAGHANRAAKECDLVIAIGTHFSDVDTGGWTLFDIPDKTKLVHIDIDPSEIARVYPAEVGIFSDAKLALVHLHEALKSLDLKADRWSDWRAQLTTWREAWEQEVASMRVSDQAPLSYARLCNDVSNVVNAFFPDTSVFIDTGHLLSFAPPFYKVTRPHFYHNGFFHCMGWSLAAAFGAKSAAPDRPALAVLGDGSFLFSSTTLATAYEYDLPVTAVVLNNRSLQIEREAMLKFYGRTAFVDSVKQTTNEPWSPDLIKVAEAMGSKAVKITKPDDLSPAIKRALASGSSWVIDVDIDVNAPGYRSVWYPYPNDFWVSKDDLPKHL